MVPVFFLCLLLAAALQYSDASKVLIYDLKCQRSHVQFANEVADILVDEGYDVVMLSNVLDERLADVGSKRVRRYIAPQVDAVALLGGGRMNDTAWTTHGFAEWVKKVNFAKFVEMFYLQCESILGNRELIDQLKVEKFDAALFATLDVCGLHIVNAIGVDNYAFIDLHSTLPASFHYSAVPESLSCVPGRFAQQMDMTSLGNRFSNFVMHIAIENVYHYLTNVYDNKILAKFSYLKANSYEIAANASYVFINRDPQVDFPTLTTHRVVDVGGMTMTTSSKSLNEHWSSVLSLRPKTVLISFGTVGNSADMPEHYKRALLETLKEFPNVTFIWKYEKPSHNISRGVDNLIEATWLPQKEMLRDSRLSAFITQCGISSTFETMHAGVPIIAIPTLSDQYRNALMFKRNGGGIVMDKEDLGNSKRMIAAVREILYNPEHTIFARRVASRLASSPVSSKENFLRHFEFLVKFGPLHHLKHVGATQSFVQYYSIDVIAILASVMITVITVVLASCYFLVSRMVRIQIVDKVKAE